MTELAIIQSSLVDDEWRALHNSFFRHTSQAGIQKATENTGFPPSRETSMPRGAPRGHENNRADVIRGSKDPHYVFLCSAHL